MGQQVKLTGIVLSATPIGDFDKRLVILTKEYGKISAFAKGARRPNSPFMAISQPFAYGTFILYEGKSSFNVNSADIEEYFDELKQDLDTLYFAMYFCEMVDYFMPEGSPDVEMLKLLYISLKALLRDALPNELVKTIFELKILAIYGLMMGAFVCVHCNKEELVGFSASMGGLVCEACKEKAKDFVPLTESTIYTIQYVLSQPVEKLYRFVVSEKVLDEFSNITKLYREKHVEHTFKSLEFLINY